MNNTPLRYPGGKSIMTPFFERLIEQHIGGQNVVYIEPYAGGAGTAINLLLSNKVRQIRINDAAIGIYSFWNSIVTEGDRFVEMIKKTSVDLPEWKRQRHIFKTAQSPSIELGFATFFLSRTNRSGILGAGPMGGQDIVGQEEATYKIDCRFNKTDLIARIERIVNLKNRIYVSNLDALDFLKQIDDDLALVYLDPPYYNQGKALYLNYYQHEDHLKLSNYLKNKTTFDWVLSYDNVPEILDLYSDFPLYQFNLSYTAQNIKLGSELMTHSSKIKIPLPISTKKRTGNIVMMEIS